MFSLIDQSTRKEVDLAVHGIIDDADAGCAPAQRRPLSWLDEWLTKHKLTRSDLRIDLDFSVWAPIDVVYPDARTWDEVEQPERVCSLITSLDAREDHGLFGEYEIARAMADRMGFAGLLGDVLDD